MDWLEQVKTKQRRHNQILFDRNSILLQPLREQIAQQHHIVVVVWCFDCLQSLAAILRQRWGEDARIDQVLDICRQWAKGGVKMPQAKAAILAVHGIAKETADPIIAAWAHAIGQGCGSIHTEAHAIGMVTYDLTAMVHQYGIEQCRQPIEEKVQWYMDRLSSFHDQDDLLKQTWAPFLYRERENAEARLIKKMKEKSEKSKR